MANQNKRRYPSTREARAEQALAYYDHDIDAAVAAGWDREDLVAAELRINLALDSHDPQLTAEEAAAVETARKYAGTTPEWRREDHVIHRPEI